MRRDSWPSARIRSGREVAIAMSNQLSKTICFICGACAMSVYVNHDSLSHILSLNSPAMRDHVVVIAPSACRRHSQLELSSLVSDVLEFHMPRTYRRCVCSRDTGTPSIFQRLGSTFWYWYCCVVNGDLVYIRR
jgi:hypothetical protein